MSEKKKVLFAINKDNNPYDKPEFCVYEDTDDHVKVCLEGKQLTSSDGKVKSIEKISPWLYEASFDTVDYEAAKEFFASGEYGPAPAGCSGAQWYHWFGRNFDWTYDNTSTIVVRTAATKGLYKTMGVVGGVDQYTEEFLDNRDGSTMWDVMPFMILDGINEHGVFVSTNVVPRDKGKNSKTIPSVEEREEISSRMLPRFVLDHYSHPYDAVLDLEKYVSVCINNKLVDADFEPHWIIGNNLTSYVLEIVDNHLVHTENHIMTNFHLHGVTFNDDGLVYTPATVPEGGKITELNGITEHGVGLERYNIIQTYFDQMGVVATKELMQDLMSRLEYTHAYKTSTNPYWHTEFTGGDLTVDSPVADFAEIEALSKYAFEHRSRDKESPYFGTWATCHSAVYNTEKKVLYLTAQMSDNSAKIERAFALNQENEIEPVCYGRTIQFNPDVTTKQVVASGSELRIIDFYDNPFGILDMGLFDYYLTKPDCIVIPQTKVHIAAHNIPDMEDFDMTYYGNSFGNNGELSKKYFYDITGKDTYVLYWSGENKEINIDLGDSDLAEMIATLINAGLATATFYITYTVTPFKKLTGILD